MQGRAGVCKVMNCGDGHVHEQSLIILLLSRLLLFCSSLDERMSIRRPHENPSIKMIYDKWLGKPNSHEAHHMLHTHYVAGGPAELKE